MFSAPKTLLFNKRNAWARPSKLMDSGSAQFHTKRPRQKKVGQKVAQKAPSLFQQVPTVIALRKDGKKALQSI